MGLDSADTVVVVVVVVVVRIVARALVPGRLYLMLPDCWSTVAGSGAVGDSGVRVWEVDAVATSSS